MTTSWRHGENDIMSSTGNLRATLWKKCSSDVHGINLQYALKEPFTGSPIYAPETRYYYNIDLTDHVRLLCKHAVVQTFGSHPLDRELYFCIFALTEVGS